MKKINRSLLCLTILSLAACRKMENLPCDPRNGNTEFKQCVIRELTYSNEDPDNLQTHHFVLAYNNRRDPVSATPDWIGTGSSQQVFYYDHQGRLVNYADLYANGTSFEFWHQYYYDAKGRIVGDSTYIFGEASHPGDALFRRYSALYYDGLNRVIKEEMSPNPYGGPPPYTIIYGYDASGNPGGSHDNKVNFLLTNRVWRFITRDYSVNNQMAADSYNDHGLPTRFSSPPPGGGVPSIFGISGLPYLTIQYDCGGMK